MVKTLVKFGWYTNAPHSCAVTCVRVGCESLDNELLVFQESLGKSRSTSWLAASLRLYHSRQLIPAGMVSAVPNGITDALLYNDRDPGLTQRTAL